MQTGTESDVTQEQRLKRWIQTYEMKLLRMCYMLLQDKTLAEETVQETFYKAYLDMNQYHEGSSEKIWLMKIAVNSCKDMRRSVRMRHITPDILPKATIPYEKMDEELVLAVMALPLKLKEVVLLHDYQDMSADEIAQVLGIPSFVVSRRIKQAVKQLKIILEGGQVPWMKKHGENSCIMP